MIEAERIITDYQFWDKFFAFCDWCGADYPEDCMCQSVFLRRENDPDDILRLAQEISDKMDAMLNNLTGGVK